MKKLDVKKKFQEKKSKYGKNTRMGTVRVRVCTLNKAVLSKIRGYPQDFDTLSKTP